MRVGETLSQIAKNNKITQQSIADKCNISRISVHRFFTGQTELKASNFLDVLEVLEIDAKMLIKNKLTSEFSEWLDNEEKIRRDHGENRSLS